MSNDDFDGDDDGNHPIAKRLKGFFSMRTHSTLNFRLAQPARFRYDLRLTLIPFRVAKHDNAHAQVD
jgi:hypothetical protein